jgi:teichuronic acid biosynthesis glycosyltransferase TuaG
MNTGVSVSIVMPAFNATRTIENSIRSALSQTFSDLELLVIDDCSTDNTSQIIRKIAFADSRVRLIESEVNSGSPAMPRNIGIKNSRGRYVAFLDSDDSWAFEKLEVQVRFMEMSGASISCTGYTVKNSTGKKIGAFIPPQVVGYRELLSENTLGCSTVMIDLAKISNLRFPVCGHEDYALWLKLTRGGMQVYALQEMLASYQVASGSVSSNKLKVLGYFWNIYRNFERFSFIRSLMYCGRYAWNVRSKYSRRRGVF